MVKNIDSYTEDYMNDYGFEAEMVRYRRAFLMKQFATHAPRTVIEIGCGTELQAAAYQAAGGSWDQWVIVEPSDVFAKIARQTDMLNIEVIQGFFEDVKSQMPTAPDMILCSGLLHEVPDSDVLIKAIAACMSSETILHINVPNASSLHRQLAKSMGIIDDLKTLSARNSTLQQPRVYDRETLETQLKGHNLSVLNSGGYLVKPFTHDQMAPLVNFLGRDVMDGLYALGQQLPDMASEIYVELKLTP